MDVAKELDAILDKLENISINHNTLKESDQKESDKFEVDAEQVGYELSDIYDTLDILKKDIEYILHQLSNIAIYSLGLPSI